MKPFTLNTAAVVDQQTNSRYPNRHTITSQVDLVAATRFDHVAADYVNAHRSAANFVSSDCVVMDIDNDHSEDPADWMTPEGLAAVMGEVTFMTATSRNHQRDKNGISARPRFHVYFPINRVTDAEQYAGLKKRLAARFGFFDRQALDAGRFIYGTPHPATTVNDGGKLLDAGTATGCRRV